jgi:hypothetical protein
MLKITPESIANGVDRELSRVVERGRAMVFVRTPHNSFGMCSCKLAPDGTTIERVYGVCFLSGDRLNELDHALVTARKAWDA